MHLPEIITGVEIRIQDFTKKLAAEGYTPGRATVANFVSFMLQEQIELLEVVKDATMHEVDRDLIDEQIGFMLAMDNYLTELL
jgi:hypothetical protein